MKIAYDVQADVFRILNYPSHVAGEPPRGVDALALKPIAGADTRPTIGSTRKWLSR